MKNLYLILGAVLVLFGLAFLVQRFLLGGTGKLSLLPENKVRIGYSLGVTLEERWLKDLEHFKTRASELNADVISLDANNDVDLQAKQVESLLLQGIDVLVVVPEDSSSVELVEKAHEYGVKVIAYDRMINSEQLDYYVSFDSVKVGEMQAQAVVNAASGKNIAYIGGSEADNNAFLLKEGSMSVLQPLLDSGNVTLVVDKFSPKWNPDEAYKNIRNYLATGKKLDGVVAANDGTAAGVVQALKQYGLDGKVPVSGQDADLAAMKRIVAGTQTASVYKPIKDLAYKAAEMAVDAARNKKVETNATVKNSVADIPSFLLTPSLVTKDTIMSTVVADGFHSQEDIY